MSTNNNFNVLFISEDTLKEYSFINENVDKKLLIPVIRMVQDIYLTELLGTSLTVDLQNKVALLVSSGTTLSSDDAYLLKAYITPFLCWRVLQEATVFMTFKYTNKGVQVQTADNSTAASDQDLQLLVNKARVAAGQYGKALVRHLCNNSTLYPAYNQSTNGEDIRPKNSTYRPSVYLGNSGGYGRDYENARDYYDQHPNFY